MEKVFEDAASYVKSHVPFLDQEHLLFFYGRYKRVKDGPCNVEKPILFMVEQRKKWQAWKDCDSLSKEEAATQYIDKVNELDPDWSNNDNNCWSVSVSSMMKVEEDKQDGDKSILDWVIEDRIDKVRQFLNHTPSLVSVKDENGLGLIHWAADRGHVSVLELVLERDSKALEYLDNDGQTGLHYAASCGHIEVVKYLLERGIDSTIKDNDGLTASDIALDNSVRDLIKANSIN